MPKKTFISDSTFNILWHCKYYFHPANRGHGIFCVWYFAYFTIHSTWYLFIIHRVSLMLRCCDKWISLWGWIKFNLIQGSFKWLSFFFFWSILTVQCSVPQHGNSITNQALGRTGDCYWTSQPYWGLLQIFRCPVEVQQISTGRQLEVPRLTSLLQQRHGSISRDSAFDVSNL